MTDIAHWITDLIERLVAALHEAVFEASGIVKNFAARLDAAAQELTRE